MEVEAAGGPSMSNDGSAMGVMPPASEPAVDGHGGAPDGGRGPRATVSGEVPSGPSPSGDGSAMRAAIRQSRYGGDLGPPATEISPHSAPVDASGHEPDGAEGAATALEGVAQPGPSPAQAAAGSPQEAAERLNEEGRQQGRSDAYSVSRGSVGGGAGGVRPRV